MENKKWIVFKNKKWFTLIEMLIVIVIIGILAAAIIPRLNSARGRANDVARKADLNQVATALITYQLDKGGFLATGTTIDNISDVLIEWWMTSIPKDPANQSLFSGVTMTNATPWNYAYKKKKKSWIPNWWFVLMAQMESPGQANYVFCNESSTWINMNTKYEHIILCTNITNTGDCSSCNYKNLSELRYVYKY